jgi:hypothetical protein
VELAVEEHRTSEGDDEDTKEDYFDNCVVDEGEDEADP